MRYARIEQLRQHHAVAAMCRILDVSESGYHAWRQRPPSARQQENLRLETEVKAAHQRTRETYGPRRLRSDLADHGIQTSLYRIKRIRRKLGLRCKQKRKFKATTDSRHALPLAPNLLDRQFTVAAPDRAWVSDITYVATDEGWLYLAGHKDIFTKEIVGYAMDGRMTKELVSESLHRAVAYKRHVKGLIHHSDRGSQYCSHEYSRLLKQLGMKASMSRKGNCYDNAPMESFWGTLKSELVHHRRYKTRQEAIQDITEYIEIFYNRQRRQAKLGFLSPAAYEQKYYNRQLAA